MVRTSVTHSAIASCATFYSYHILTSSVIYYWTDARQHGIYLLNIARALSPSPRGGGILTKISFVIFDIVVKNKSNVV